ncbi:C-C motif chemokine 3-like [Scomber scombrus]|uniref:C-C motif chemokine n=1 Tax=Scomber scombrus TaxID=13677 RepID=A0AAV1NSV5_SCOSC
MIQQLTLNICNNDSISSSAAAAAEKTLLQLYTLSFRNTLNKDGFGPDECCFKHYPRVLGKKSVVSYKHTDKQCPTAGVLFTMRNGAQFCVNPSAEWVQKIIKAKDKAMAAKVSTSGSQTTVTN